MSKQIKYAPILKWKAAEITALENISSDNKKGVAPIIELVLPSVNAYKDKERKQKKTDEEIHAEMVEKMVTKRFVEIPDEIKKSWGSDEIYVDVTLLHNKDKTNQLKIDAINKLAEEAKIKGLKIVPVINIADDSLLVGNISNLISKKLVEEVCLRVMPSSLKDVETLNKKISDLLGSVKISKESAHLLIDLKYIDSLSGGYGEMFDNAQKIIELKKFKEFIFASGAFPVDMLKCTLEESTYLPRTDWTSWVSNVKEKKLVRVPIYSDYSIRYPLYNDSLQFFESTSTLKYTVESQWMIMKGTKRALHMYLGHASLLTQQPEFNTATYGKGAKFSFGDDYISKKAEHFKVWTKDNSVKGTGRTQDWIAAGISHHTAVVMHQLSSLHD